MNKIKRQFVKILVLLSINYNAYAMTYYVSNLIGNDNNIGTNITTPVKTIQRGIDKATMANDTIYVMKGVYKEELLLNKDNIAILSYQNDTPIIDGDVNLPTETNIGLIKITGNNNTISGFEIRNSNIIKKLNNIGEGIIIYGHDNIISKNTIHHNWQNGILNYGDNNTIANNNIYLNSYKNTTGNISTWFSGIKSGNNLDSLAIAIGITSNTIIENNIVYNNYGEGVLCYESNNCLIKNNIIYDNWTTNLQLTDTTNTTYKNNLIYNSSKSDIIKRNNSNPLLISLIDINNGKSRSANNLIYNNMLYNGDINLFNTTNVVGYGLSDTLFSNNTIINGKLLTPVSINISTNSNITNNIIYNSSISTIPTKTGITFSNNNWLIKPASNAVSNTDIIGDPNIAKTGATTAGALTTLYFKLNTGSGAIDKGKDLSTHYTTDLFETTRPINNIWDIGAHEYFLQSKYPQPICKMICTTP